MNQTFAYTKWYAPRRDRMEFEGFDWDKGNRDKCQSHGVTMGDIESLFRGAISLVPDPRHSAREERLKAIGRTSEGRAVLVVHHTTARNGAFDPARQRAVYAQEGSGLV